MDRTFIYDLEQWRGAPNRKPLVLMGARQVGKTYVLKQFASKNYQNLIYLNFEKDKKLGEQLFSKSLDPNVIIKTLATYYKEPINPGTTLIIFDEVQECPDALNCLKYFHEDANQYHICAAGSLLGVKLLNVKGFPVGQVNIKYLFPMDFVEFLLAIQEDLLITEINNIYKIQPVIELLHNKLLELFKLYMITGGMPEAIKAYMQTADFQQVREKQYEILQAYNLDFAKHAPKEQLMKIMQVWESIPSQLTKENKKFIYSVIRHGARAKEFELAIQWLVEAELICKANNVQVPNLPLAAYASQDIFKLYMFDVGLYGAVANLDPAVLIQGDDLFKEFKGSLTETYVAQVLHKLNAGLAKPGLYYWTSEGRAEVDFIIQYQNGVYPLEVKSAYTNKHKSLNVYKQAYAPKLSLRTSPQNLILNDQNLNVPLYMLCNINSLLQNYEHL